MNTKILIFAAAVTIHVACKKTSTEKTTVDNNTTGAITDAGFGSSKMPFKNAAWQLPAGIQLQDSIHEFSYCFAFPPYRQVPRKDWKGVPPGFTFCLTLKNTTAQSITIEFPPQLLFVSTSSLHQNVLTIDLGILELPAGTEKTIVAQGFCINQGREIPQTYDQVTGDFLSYTFGPSVIPAQLQEIANIIKAKHITIQSILNADGTIDPEKVTKFSVIQTAIWEVTDKQGLTGKTRTELLNL